MKLIGVSAETSPSFSARVHSMWPPVPRKPARDHPQPGDALRPFPYPQRRQQRHRHPQQGGVEHDAVGRFGVRQLLDLDRDDAAAAPRPSSAISVPVLNSPLPGRTITSTPTKPSATAAQRRARTCSLQEDHRGDGHEHRRRIRQRHRLRQRQVADRPEAAEHRQHADQAADEVARQLRGAQQRRARAAAAAAARRSGRRNCGRTRSRTCAASARPGGSRPPSAPKNSGAAEHQQRGAHRVWRLPCCAHQRRADDPRFRLDRDAEARPAPSRRCVAPDRAAAAPLALRRG